MANGILGRRRPTWGTRDGRPVLIDRGTGVDFRPTTVALGDPQASVFTPAPSATTPSQVTPAPRAPSGDGGILGTSRDGSIEPGVSPTGGFDPIRPFADRAVASIGSLVDRANQTEKGQRALNTAIDAATGLPFGIASTLLNPRIVPTSWGTDFNTGGGGIIGVGGELSRRNLERVYGEALAEHAPTGETNPDYLREAYGGGTIPTHAPGATTNFYAPGDIPGVRTPIATHEGFIPGTRVVSGNVDLAPGLRRGPEEPVYAPEVDAYAQERIRVQQEQERLAQLRQDQQLQAALRQRQEQERQARQAEQTRLEREAADRARAEAERQANIQRANEELARRNREREDSGQAPQQGRAVTDSQGRAVRDSSGGIVTDRPTERDSDGGGGGGGGGTWCCTAAIKQGMPIKKVKELRKWHRQQSQLWQNGYDRWGKFIADNLVDGSPFWASVTEEGHNLFVNKKLTLKGALAWLVIAPGSYIAGGIDAIQKRSAKTVSLGERTGDSSEMGKQI